MQNGAQHQTPVTGRLLGFVRVLIGGHVHDLAVQAVTLDKDGDRAVGGLFIQDDQLGILVDDALPEADKKAQIEQATEEAVLHLSKKFLN